MSFIISFLVQSLINYNSQICTTWSQSSGKLLINTNNLSRIVSLRRILCKAANQIFH